MGALDLYLLKRRIFEHYRAMCSACAMWNYDKAAAALNAMDSDLDTLARHLRATTSEHR